MAEVKLAENSFTFGDRTTFYWSAGPADGPLLIFIHGWPGNGETWKPQLKALAALGFRVIAPDMQGYGRSTVTRNIRDYSLENHVASMLALLSHLDRPKAIWIGHDWGAGLVWAFAAHQPQACIGVVNMCVPYRLLEFGIEEAARWSNRQIYPASEYPVAQWDYQRYHEESPEESARLLGANVANTIKMLYSPGNPATYGQPAFSANLRKRGGWFGGLQAAPDSDFDKSLLRDDRERFDRMCKEFEKNGFEAPNAYYLNHDVNKVYSAKSANGGYLDFPVLFIGARWDSVCDTTLSQLNEPMRAYCRDLTECNIEAGHWVALEKPQETNAAIVRWIATKLPTQFPSYWKTPFSAQAGKL